MCNYIRKNANVHAKFVHIISVKMSIGKKDKKKKIILMQSSLKKNSRNIVNRKAGTKAVPCDQNNSVKAAPGSVDKRTLN